MSDAMRTPLKNTAINEVQHLWRVSIMSEAMRTLCFYNPIEALALIGGSVFIIRSRRLHENATNVLIPPETDIDEVLAGRVLGEDPPLVTAPDDLRERRACLNEVRDVNSGRRHAMREDPEGHVEVRASDGPIHRLGVVNGRQQRGS